MDWGRDIRLISLIKEFQFENENTKSENMKLRPQDFFIGVIDFFSVILLGALVTYFLKGLLYADVFGTDKIFPSPETKTQQWIVFFLATYIIGNIIFLIASLLLDKLAYDKHLRNRFYKKNFDLSYHTATAIRDQYLPSESCISQLINAKKLKEKEIKELLKKIDTKSSFEISNKQQEPLMLLILR